ncbi:stalk domain-containing protein [Cytobacillus sp. IB215316]|uniref:stalk domain-containing protein n=1 Tax=Cytobacillus sp. IB215316 TaxID=3097354 RepID=UPI002A108E6C|nr:stalk domain-containing protein [Cytobacillus sp. IB215316]MDX8363225.1 stalk domain-containing protein [Cytobacillus sp. IB215316]
MKKKLIAGVLGVSIFTGGLGVYAGTVIEQYKTPRGNTATVEEEIIHKNRIGVTVNGEKVDSNTWYHEEEKTFVKLRDVAEMLGAKVEYNEDTMSADITLVSGEQNNDHNESTGELGKSRANAAGIGEKVVVNHEDILDGLQKFELTLTDVISGESAWNMIKEANSFNEPPEKGKMYVLAKFKVSVLELANEPMDINHSQFESVSSSGVLYDDFVSIVTPDPDLSTKLYSDSEYEGWTYFLVDETDSPKAVFLEGRDAETWFDLEL